MKGVIPIKRYVPVKQLPLLIITSLSFMLLFSSQALNADILDDCLLEALKKAEGFTTVDQLHQQCQQITETSLKVQPLPDSSVADDFSVSGNNTPDSNGPAEVVLQTSQAKKPAFFPHKRHQDKYTCGTCHHGEDTNGRIVKYESGEDVYKCVTCHNANMPNQELNGLKLIGHQLCRECHRRNQNVTSAKCSTCHRKNL